MKPITVLIPDGEKGLTLDVVRALGFSKQVHVHLLTNGRWPVAGISRYCQQCHFTSSSLNHPQRGKAILDVVQKMPIDVVLPVSVEGIRIVLAQRQALENHAAIAPLSDTQTFELANDKASLSCLAREHDIRVPPFVVVQDHASNCFDWASFESLKFPVLFKPTTLFGGQGIRRFDDAASLKIFLESRSNISSHSRFMLQSYIRGQDMGLNVLCRDGEILAHTVQMNPLSIAPPFGASGGNILVHDPQALELGKKLVAKLRWSGVANFDLLRSTTGETFLLEINPRYWSSLMGSVLAGVNFPFLACLAALGHPLPNIESQKIAYANQAVLFEEIRRKMLGRSMLQGLRLKHTSLAIDAIDPLPAMLASGKFLLKKIRKIRSR